MTWATDSTGHPALHNSRYAVCALVHIRPRMRSSAQLGLMLHTAIVGGNAGRRIEYGGMV